MNNKLICPFCQQELQETYDGKQFWCSNYKDPTHPINLQGTKELWQELIRTRKALDVAKSKLNGIHRLYSKAFYTREDWLQVCMEMVDKANTALEQITALEQKKSEFVHNKIEFPEFNDNLLEEFDKQFFENGQDDDLTETVIEQKDK